MSGSGELSSAFEPVPPLKVCVRKVTPEAAFVSVLAPPGKDPYSKKKLKQ